MPNLVLDAIEKMDNECIILTHEAKITTYTLPKKMDCGILARKENDYLSEPLVSLDCSRKLQQEHISAGFCPEMVRSKQVEDKDVTSGQVFSMYLFMYLFTYLFTLFTI